MAMSSVLSDLQRTFADLFAVLRTQVCAALSVAPDCGGRTEESHAVVDPDFDGWLHGDPMVTKNPTSRYGDRTPGYITGNGLGSMEIGAADD